MKYEKIAILILLLALCVSIGIIFKISQEQPQEVINESNNTEVIEIIEKIEMIDLCNEVKIYAMMEEMNKSLINLEESLKDNKKSDDKVKRIDIPKLNNSPFEPIT